MDLLIYLIIVNRISHNNQYPLLSIKFNSIKIVLKSMKHCIIHKLNKLMLDIVHWDQILLIQLEPL